MLIAELSITIIISHEQTEHTTEIIEKEDSEMVYINNFNENVKAMEEEFNRQVNELQNGIYENTKKMKKS